MIMTQIPKFLGRDIRKQTPPQCVILEFMRLGSENSCFWKRSLCSPRLHLDYKYSKTVDLGYIVKYYNYLKQLFSILICFKILFRLFL